MSRSKGIKYPPGDVLNPIVGKTDYDYVILWMLNNNEYCEWSDFVEEISESTLSGHLRKLKNKYFVEKPERNKYRITKRGIERFNELTYNMKIGKRRLIYPPKTILNKRNYDHWILWMLYNNYSCKWIDFKQAPLSINQSALSNNINSLIEEGYIDRENKEYVITPLGKSHYFTILKQYDLDRQSILEQQSKRVEEITEKTSEFFNRYNIKNQELKFRYINYVLTLDYSKVETTLRNEEDFNKILLFLAINHPDQYSNYLTPEEFSQKYNIDITTLNYYIKEIVDNQFFKIKFFNIEDDIGQVYYFQKNEPLEKILNAIVEKYITKFTYLNKFQDNPSLNIEFLLEKILNDICGNLFDVKFEIALKNFLPEYIKYLAYKIETEKTLIDSEAKLEGFVWQNIFEEFLAFQPSTIPIETGKVDEYTYTLDKSIFSILDIFYISKINFLQTDEIQEFYDLKNVKIFDEMNELLYHYKTQKARELYEKNKEDLTEIHQLIFEDLINTIEYNFKASITLTNKIIKKNPKDFIGYLLQSITYFLMDDYDNSLDVIEKGLNEAPNILLFCQKAQLFIKIRRGEEIFSDLNEHLSKHPNNVPLLRTKHIYSLNQWHMYKKSYENFFNSINSAIKLKPTDQELLLLKSISYVWLNKYKEAEKFIKNKINLSILKKNPKIDTSALFILTFSYTARGKYNKVLKIINQLYDMYPDHPVSFIIKSLLQGYNLIYKFKFDQSNIHSFLELIDTMLSLEPLKYNKVQYLLLKANILHGIQQYDKVIETINSAIELIPNLYFLYLRKSTFLTVTNQDDKALNLIEELNIKIPQLKFNLGQQKTCILVKQKKYEDALKSTNNLLKFFPDRVEIINNRSIILAYLNRREEALESAEYLIQLNPNVGNSYDSYGIIHMFFEEYEQAIEKFEEAIRIDPTSDFVFQTWLNLGFCYKKLKKYDKALESFEKGKLLTERMIPCIREFYFNEAFNEAKKNLSEIKNIIEKLKKRDHQHLEK
ncbi:MAG: tetratricopeptide repeat protein [Promethearchaeota archaeon]